MGILSTIYFSREITRQQREARQARKERRQYARRVQRQSFRRVPFYTQPTPDMVIENEPARLTWAVAVILEQGEEIAALRRRIEQLEREVSAP